jgi:Uma2 family endonuclease
MATATIVPLSEYLDSSYRPDREYIDGILLERNMGESDHSRLQALLIGYLLNRESQWGIVVMPEQRVQVKSTRYRVPDITVVAGPLPSTPILHEPPFLCIEILSRGDSVYEMQDRIDDYLTFGVRYVWILNPRTRRAFIYTADGMREAKDGILRTQNPDIEVPLAALE